MHCLPFLHFFCLRLVVNIFYALSRIYQKIVLKDVDKMDGLDFERYVMVVLRKQGYSNIKPTEKYDYGVDIIAQKDGIKWGIQAKRYSGLVKASAVRQVVTGLSVYGCDRAMVITNSTFSKVAVQLAQSNNCVLVDSWILSRMIREV